MANQVDLLDVRWVMVEDDLSDEVEVPGLTWIEFKAYDGEALSSYKTLGWV